jgi:hypothetical protein
MARCMVLLIGLMMVIAAGTPAAHAEEGTVKASSPWFGKGRIYLVKEKQALFMGAFDGNLYMENQQGDFDKAKIICPGMVEINLDKGDQSGKGRCIVQMDSGDRVYATWTCAGEVGQGCAGDFSLLGGTGRFDQITGKSAFEIRSELANFAIDLGLESGHEFVEVEATGIAVWPALTYKIP